MGCLVDVSVRFSCVNVEASCTAIQLKDSDAVLRKWVAAMNKHPKLRTKNSTAKSMPKSGGINWSLTLLLVMLAGSHGWLLGWYSGSQAMLRNRIASSKVLPSGVQPVPAHIGDCFIPVVAVGNALHGHPGTAEEDRAVLVQIDVEKDPGRDPK